MRGLTCIPSSATRIEATFAPPSDLGNKTAEGSSSDTTEVDGACPLESRPVPCCTGDP